MHQIRDRERQSREELFRLMADNPDLPVVPMVDTEIVGGDDFGRWMGRWGSVWIDKYLIPEKDYEPLIFKSSSDYDIFNALERYFSNENFENIPDSDTVYRQIYDELPWTEAIIVQIDPIE